MSRPLSKHVRAVVAGVGALMFLTVGGGHYTPSDPHDTHVVAVGESLGSIASSHGVPVAQIVTANGLLGDSTIYVGNQLRLSGQGFVPSVAATHHTVEKADTAAHFASHHGVSSEQFAHLNGFDEGATLEQGQVVHVAASSWVCPVDDGRFFNDWGFPRSGGRFHTGTDLFAPRGTPVRAPVSGVVRQITGSAGGFQFELTDDAGNIYLGSHMDRFDAAGRVDAGTIVGYVGDTGNARGSDPHLHFQIHPRGGDPVNPYPSLRLNQCG